MIGVRRAHVAATLIAVAEAAGAVLAWRPA
jgi:hypothetical protein